MSWKDELLAISAERQKAVQSDLRKQLEQVRRAYARLEKTLGVALAIRDTPREPYRIEPSRKSASESVPIFVASDWHCEETVDPQTVNDSNAFNLTIADARVAAFFRNAVKLVNIQRAGTDIHESVLALIGDFISGYIHEELVENNELSPTEAVLWLIPRLEAGIRYLLKHGEFKRITIPCCSGNHGRTTQKQRISTGYRNSYEWLMYHVLKMAFKDEPRVRFQIANGYHNLLPIYGRMIRFHHGESIRYGGGVGGLYIPAHKAIAQWNKGTPAYLDIFGHWHQRLDGGCFVSNSSLIGFNAFALSIKATPEPPQQSFVLIEKTKGKTITAPIWLD